MPHRRRRLGVGGHRPHRQTQLGPLEEQEEHGHHHRQHQRPHRSSATAIATSPTSTWLDAERRLEALVEVPQISWASTVETEEDPDGDDDDRQGPLVRIAQRRHRHLVQQRADRGTRRPSPRGWRATCGMPSSADRPDEERREHGHLALGEVEQAGGAVDDHEAEAEHRVDRPVADAVDEYLRGSRVIIRTPGTPCGRTRPPAAPRPSRVATMLAGLEHVGAGRDLEGEVGVLLDQRARPCPSPRLRSPRRSNSSWVTSGARPSDGSSSSSSRGRRHERPGDGQHLLLAAGHGARRLVAALAEPGEDLVPAVDVGVDLAVASGCRHRGAGSPRR